MIPQPEAKQLSKQQQKQAQNSSREITAEQLLKFKRKSRVKKMTKLAAAISRETTATNHLPYTCRDDLDNFEVVDGQLVRLPTQNSNDHPLASISRQQMVETLKCTQSRAKVKSATKKWIDKHY